MIVQMYGGGICQGSSTLYIAALKAGMEIVERWCHAMPSSYCPIGLDATVDYREPGLPVPQQLGDPGVHQRLDGGAPPCM